MQLYRRTNAGYGFNTNLFENYNFLARGGFVNFGCVRYPLSSAKNWEHSLKFFIFAEMYWH